MNKSDEVKLLPCPTPWCDRSETPEPWQDCDDGYSIICPVCQVEGPYADTEEDARDLWNTRPSTLPDDLVERVETALSDAIKNADMRRGEVVLHGRDWLALRDAIAALRRMGERELANATRAVCTRMHGGYCECVGHPTHGCRVGRGESPDIRNCKMTDNALPLTVEYVIAEAVVAALQRG